MDIITPTMTVPENQITLKEQNAVIMTWKMHLWLSAEFVGMRKLGQPSKFDEQYALDILASFWSLLSHSSRYQNGSLGNICNLMGESRICRH